MKIRTIKPSFWSSATIAAVPRDARLVFIGLWNEADDEGRLLGSPKRLAGVLFEHDEDVDAKTMTAWLTQLEAARLVQRYEVKGVAYLVIPGFSEHQKIDRRFPSRLPAPPDAAGESLRLLAANSASPAATSEGLAAKTPLEVELEVELEVGTAVQPRRPAHAPVDPTSADAAPSSPPSGALGRGHRRFASRLPHEMALWRETPEELLAAPDPDNEARSFAARLAERYPALDNHRGRPSVLDRLKAKWPAFEKKFWSHGPSSAFPALVDWIGEGYDRHRRDWERDGGVDPASLASPAAPMQRLRPVDDADDEAGVA